MSPLVGRLSVNSETVKYCPLPELIDAAAARGFGGVGLWREPLREAGVDRIVKRLRDAGLAVSSLCRGGFLTTADPAERLRRIADNRHAIEEAAAVGAPVVVLVCGGLPAGGTNLAAAEAMITDALAELAPYAAVHGVRLGVEPMHPMYCADRSVLVTLDQAARVATRFPADQVGVVVDSYHVWWDPELRARLRALRGRILGVQVSDWVTPLPEGVLTGRGQLGDGSIDLRGFVRLADEAGYTGLVEAEIFNAALWTRPAAEVLDELRARYVEHVG